MPVDDYGAVVERVACARGRDIISCPMFDPGSAWFEQRTGEYSNPAVATFFVDNGHVADLRFVEP